MAMIDDQGLAHWLSAGPSLCPSVPLLFQMFVKVAICDMIALAGLKHDMLCLNELSIFDMREDIRVVTHKGDPVLAIAIRTPLGPDCETPLSDARLCGEMYDYMQRLRTFHNLRYSCVCVLLCLLSSPYPCVCFVAGAVIRNKLMSHVCVKRCACVWRLPFIIVLRTGSPEDRSV